MSRRLSEPHYNVYYFQFYAEYLCKMSANRTAYYMYDLGSRWNRSWANFWCKFCVQLPWTTSSPHVKGDYHVFSNTGFIRHGAVVCRIVNWTGLTAYNVTSPLNIWTKFRVWLLRTLFGDPPQEKIVSYLFSILLSGGDRCWGGGAGGGGGRWNCYCEMWIFNIYIKVHYSARVMNCKLWIVNCKTNNSSLFGPNIEL